MVDEEKLNFGKLTTREINSLSRKMANKFVGEYRAVKSIEMGSLMTIEQARRAPIEDVKYAFMTLKSKDRLPRSAHFTPFRIAWRGPYTITHGTISGYNQGCRRDCTAHPTCSEVWSAFQRERYQRKKAEKAARKNAEALRPFKDMALSLQSDDIPTIVRAGQEEEQREQDDGRDYRWGAMDMFVAGYPEGRIITQKTLNLWFDSCGLTAGRERIDWLLSGLIENRDGQWYRKARGVV
jgi:hypothetical protein